MRLEKDIRENPNLCAAGRARWLVAVLLAALATSGADAAPSGGEISAGSGVISTSGTTLTVDQGSARLAINWQSFNIGTDESVVFQQPSAQAIALNRILGQDPSVILGNLTANGQVFLLNPNGVLFGSGSRVDVGGLLASTLSLSNEDFLAGRYRLVADPASTGEVLNAGTLSAHDGGYVALAGTQASNEGVIRARLGTVALGAGEQITLNIDGSSLVNFSVDTAALRALVSNRGLLQADGGTVLLSARAQDAVLTDVINHTGIIEARSVSDVNGTIRLEGGNDGVVAVAGTLDASGRSEGESGGAVSVTGDKVALLDGTQVDASGVVGGGTVRIGGDYQGGNPDIQNAQRTFVGTSAEIHADALERGTGGRVIVWSDGDTRYRGEISARGGRVGGDGGLVEVSGKQKLGFDGSVDTSAEAGTTGTLLLDPDDLTIAAVPVGGAIADASNPFQAIDGVNNYYVLAGTLTALPVNTAVVLQANHDIIFQTNLAMPTTAAGSLSLTATNAITMGGFDLSTSNGSVSMTAGAGGITNLGTIGLGTGVLTLNSTGAITQNATDVIQGATALVKQGTGTLTLSRPNTYTGLTTISAGTVSATNASALGTVAAGTTVAAGATLNLNNVAVTEGLTLNGIGVGGNGALTGSGIASSSGTVAMGSASTIGVGVGADTLTLGGIVSGGFALTKVGAGTLVLGGANTYTGVTAINGGTLAVTANNALGTVAGGTTLAAGTTLDLRNVAYATAEGLTNNGGTLATSVGTSSFAGGMTLGANSSVNVTGAQLTLSGVTSGAGFGIDKQGGGLLILSGANTYTGTTAISGGTLRLGAANRIADTSAVTVASGATFDLNSLAETVGSIAGAGNITLGSATLTAGGDGTSTLFSGIVSGTGALTKLGAGTLTLSGANTYTGLTTISAGTVSATNASALGTVAAGTTVAAGATLNLNNVAVTEGLTLNGIGVGGNGALTGSGIASSSGTVAMGSASTIGVGVGADTLTLGGIVSGGFALTKVGAGTLVLGGANTYTGTTTINAGTLRASGGSAIVDTSQVTLLNAAGATLDLTANETIGNLSGGGATGGNVTLNGNTLTVNEAGATTFAGIASGTGGLTKLGAGTLTLSGANTYSGTTNVNAGTLASGANDVFADATQLVVNGGTLAMTNRNDTVAGVQLISGSITGTTGVLTSTSAYDLRSGAVSAILGGAVGLNKSTGGLVTLSRCEHVHRCDRGERRYAAVGRRGESYCGHECGDGRGRCDVRPEQSCGDGRIDRGRRQHRVGHRDADGRRCNVDAVLGNRQRYRRVDESGRGNVDVVGSQYLHGTNDDQRRHVARIRRQRDCGYVAGDLVERRRCDLGSDGERDDRQSERRRCDRRQRHVERQHVDGERGGCDGVCWHRERHRRVDQTRRRHVDPVRRKYLFRHDDHQRGHAGVGCQRRLCGRQPTRRQRRHAGDDEPQRHGGRRATANRFDHRHNGRADVDERVRPALGNSQRDPRWHRRTEQDHWGDWSTLSGANTYTGVTAVNARHLAVGRGESHCGHECGDGCERRDVRLEQSCGDGRIDCGRRQYHAGQCDADGGR